MPKNNPEDEKTSEISIRIMSESEHNLAESSKIENLIGFTLLFEEIWNSGKTFIGHNCLYDILFIYEAFIDHLPTDYQNFKTVVTDGKRKFFDTKYIACRLEENEKVFPKGTSLEEIYHFYSKTASE